MEFRERTSKLQTASSGDAMGWTLSHYILVSNYWHVAQLPRVVVIL